MAATEVVPGLYMLALGPVNAIFARRVRRLYSHRYRAAEKRSQADGHPESDSTNQHSSGSLDACAPRSHRWLRGPQGHYRR